MSNQAQYSYNPGGFIPTLHQQNWFILYEKQISHELQLDIFIVTSWPEIAENCNHTGPAPSQFYGNNIIRLEWKGRLFMCVSQDWYQGGPIIQQSLFAAFLLPFCIINCLNTSCEVDHSIIQFCICKGNYWQAHFINYIWWFDQQIWLKSQYWRIIGQCMVTSLTMFIIMWHVLQSNVTDNNYIKPSITNHYLYTDWTHWFRIYSHNITTSFSNKLFDCV